MAYDWEAARARTLGPAGRLVRTRVPWYRRWWATLRGKDSPLYVSSVELTAEGEFIQRALDNTDPKELF